MSTKLSKQLIEAAADRIYAACTKDDCIPVFEIFMKAVAGALKEQKLNAKTQEMGSDRNDEQWDEDKPLPEDTLILSAHPTQTNDHELYFEAMRLVGARRSKHGLCEVVNWLLYEKKKLSAHNTAMRETLKKIKESLPDNDSDYYVGAYHEEWKLAEHALSLTSTDAINNIERTACKRLAKLFSWNDDLGHFISFAGLEHNTEAVAEALYEAIHKAGRKKDGSP